VYSVLIRNARIVDGSGNPWYTGDVGIDGQTITGLGKLGAVRADLVIDGSGLIVAPGFIDIHTHSDVPLLVDGDGHAHIRQGVTTNVIGNCGGSAAPMTDQQAAQAGRQQFDMPDFAWDWRSLGDYFARLGRQGTSLNVAALVGQGTVRGAVMGFDDRPATPGEIAEMAEIVRQAMRDGAFGLSTGLVYVPGSYAATSEIVELARVAASYGGIYASHIRGENDTLLTAVAEAIAIGRAVRIPVQIAHFKAMGRHMWGRSVDSIHLVDQARHQGIDVTCDQYPYTASATGLGSFLPGWAHVGGYEALKQRLSDQATRARLKHDILHGLDGWVSFHKGVGWDNTLITHAQDHSLEGLTVSEIAAQQGKDEFDAAFDILVGNQGRVSVVYFTIGDEDIERIMRHDAVMIGSDSSAVAAEGPLAKGKPHPRAFGTFVRVLGVYVRQKGVISWENAVRKMTSLPAQRLGLLDRGLLRPGMKADVVLFDPATVADQATYTDPMRYPTGVEYVLVNGRLTICHGRHLGTRAGAILRHGIPKEVR